LGGQGGRRIRPAAPAHRARRIASGENRPGPNAKTTDSAGRNAPGVVATKPAIGSKPVTGSFVVPRNVARSAATIVTGIVTMSGIAIHRVPSPTSGRTPPKHSVTPAGRAPAAGAGSPSEPK